MSKQTKGYDMADFAHVTPAMIATAEGVIADQKLRRYSVSAIYKAHNGIFKLREALQTCDSCLVTRANNVKKWHDWYTTQTAAKPGAVVNPPIPTAYALEDGTTILVDAAGLARLAHADRSPVTDLDAVAPGDYLLKDGQTLTIAEGSIATTVAIKDPVITPIVAAAGTLLGGVVKNIPDAPLVPAAPVEVLIQKINKNDYSKTEGAALVALFTANADNALKGLIVGKEGQVIAPGTYATSDTTKVLGVQPGGKATYKSIA